MVAQASTATFRVFRDCSPFFRDAVTDVSFFFKGIWRCSPSHLKDSTHEIRLASKDGGPFKWLVGVYFNRRRRD